MPGDPNPIEATVRLVRGGIVVEERAAFPDTGNVNVLLQRLGADANRRFKPQMVLAKEREDREQHARIQLEREQQARMLQGPATEMQTEPPLSYSEPPTLQAVAQATENTHIFQHVNMQLDRFVCVIQQMNQRLHDLERRESPMTDIVVQNDGARWFPQPERTTTWGSFMSVVCWQRA